MTESRVENSKRNILHVFMYQIIKVILSFANRIIFIKILGAIFLGINGLFSNLLAYLSMADLGMETVMMYSLYKPLAEKNYKKVSAYLNLFNKVYNIIACVILGLGLLIVPFLKYIINLPNDVDGIYIYYILMLLNVASSYLFVYKITLLQADQKAHIINRYNSIFQIITFIFQIAILLLFKNYLFYLIITIIFTFIANYVKAKQSDKIYGKMKSTAVTISKEEKSEIIKNVKSIFMYKFGGVIQSNTDNILTSIFVGTIVVGYYSNYALIIATVTSFITILYNAIKPSVGNYIIKEDVAKQYNMFYILENYNFCLISFCTICFALLMPDFIAICFGKEYLLDNYTTFFIIANFYTSNIRQNLWAFRETTGIFEKTKYITLATAIINIILSIVGGIYFGIAGIMAATVIARMIYAWWKEPIILFNDHFKVSSRKYFIYYIRNMVLTICIIILLNLSVKYMAFGNALLTFAIKVMLVCIFTIILLVFSIRNTDSYHYFKNIIKGSRKNEN